MPTKRRKPAKLSVRRALKKKVTDLARPRDAREKRPSPSLPSRRTIEKVLR